ncbi:hypothetical protein [Nitrobacter sp.]|uniref:hypothetical protein n=1 Tax=Nitrobacter sp. TaxID=29420 RepID=UPI0029CAB965|nr:hypothetical protein [Nitrobacter sp.]
MSLCRAAKREELAHQEKPARFDEQGRQCRNEREAAEDRCDEEPWTLIDVFLASTDSITEFRLQPDDYDARTVEEALLENQQAFEAIRSHRRTADDARHR